MGQGKKWTSIEDTELINGTRPKGRTEMACHQRAHILGIHFCPNGGSPVERLSEAQVDAIAEEAARTRSARSTGRKFGVSYQTVSDICHRRGIALNPSNRERLGNYIEFEGAKYTWKNGVWRCTTGKRDSLARVIYAKYHPDEVPGRGHVVIFADGDRTNFTRGNLVLRSVSEHIVELGKDPAYRVNRYANGCLGFLEARIMEKENPEAMRRRVEKAAATRKKNNKKG